MFEVITLARCPPFPTAGVLCRRVFETLQPLHALPKCPLTFAPLNFQTGNCLILSRLNLLTFKKKFKILGNILIYILASYLLPLLCSLV